MSVINLKPFSLDPLLSHSAKMATRDPEDEISVDDKVACIDMGGLSCKLGLMHIRRDNPIAPFELLDSKTIPTGRPGETLSQIFDVLDKWDFATMGLATFGPIDLDPHSHTYGHILDTAKPYWSETPLLPLIRTHYPTIPISLSTDVEGPALLESVFGDVGTTRDKRVCYITVGAGVGGAIYDPETDMSGPIRPHMELGHVYCPIHEIDAAGDFHGVCPFHKGCIEGMASVNAVCARKGGISPDELAFLDSSDPVWELVAFYIAHMLVCATMCATPDVCVLGGGVFQRKELIGMVRKEFVGLINGYHVEAFGHDVSKFIVGPTFDGLEGVYGAAAISIRRLHTLASPLTMIAPPSSPAGAKTSTIIVNNDEGTTIENTTDTFEPKIQIVSSKIQDISKELQPQSFGSLHSEALAMEGSAIPKIIAEV